MSLSINNLQVSYAEHQVLKKLSVNELKRGSFIGLLGPNAAGKSTLFKSIAGLTKIAGGSIFLDDQNLLEMTRKDRANKVAFLPQAFHTNLALSVFESVLLSLKQRSGWRVKKEDLSNVANILALLNIEYLADKDISDLSGGQKQLAAMARILVVKPDIVLLDEPTSALDLHHQLSLLKVVREQTYDKQLITIAALHDVNLAAKFCDQLLVLNKGVIQLDGEPNEVLSKQELGATYKVTTSLEKTAKGQLYIDAQL
jgi:iron complex transport system ATP-binding protein